MISLRAYARHRKSLGLDGGTLRAVQVAIRDGRLRAAVTEDGKIRDAAEADAEWAETTKSEYVPDTGPTSPARQAAAAPAPARAPSNALAEARTRREAAQAEIREMQLAERRGELVPAKALEKHLADVFAQCRTKLLAIPARARQRDPMLSGNQLKLIEALIREALEDLAVSPVTKDERRTG